MDKRSAPAVFVGGASLLTIFAVLCLAVFALLSVSTAKSSGRIGQVSHQAAIDYYEADAQAQTILARLRSGEAVEGVHRDGDTFTYRCAISSTSVLEVAVLVQGSDYEILRYQVVSTESWTPDETLPVWDGQ